MKQILFIALCALSLTAFTTIFLSEWTIKEDYNIRFEGSGATGTFSGLEGTIVFDKANLAASKMAVSVDVNTINTGNTTKDKHAKGKSWFHATKYPKIRFTSERFESSSNGYTVTGTLEMRGVSKAFSIPFAFKESTDGGVFEGQVSVNRRDFGIDGPFISFMVSDEFKVNIRVPVGQ